MAAPTPRGLPQIDTIDLYRLVLDYNRLGAATDAALTATEARAEYVSQKAQATAESALRASTALTTVVAGIPSWSPTGSYAAGDLVIHDGYVWHGQHETVTTRNPVPNPLFRDTGAEWLTRSVLNRQASGGVLTLTATETVTVGYQLVVESEPSLPDVAPGDTVTVTAQLACPSSSPHPVNLRLVVGFAADLSVSSPQSTQVTLAPGQSETVTVTAVCPDGKTGARVRVLAGSNGVPAGAVFTVSRPIIAMGDTAPDFFTGDTTDTAAAEHEWEGTPHNSASIRDRRLDTVTGEPGDSAMWHKIMVAPTIPAGGDDGDEVRAPAPAPRGPATLTEQSITPTALSTDRTRCWSTGGTAIYESHDDGQNWFTLATWTDHVAGTLRQMPDGELLVGLSRRTGDEEAEVWRSTGYPTLGENATWEPVLTGLSPAMAITSAWGTYSHGDLVLLNEYGPKEGSNYPPVGTVPAGGNARYTRLSLDAGKTWKTIFDVNTMVNNTQGIHLHGVAWDPYWDRIWVSWGDDENGIAYSDDLGDTWHYADVSRAIAGKQVVGILPLPGCILFGTDTHPNGIYRINRSEGKHTGLYTVEVAHTLNDQEIRTHLCHGLHWSGRPQDPVLIAFGAETNPGEPVLVATYDGYSFTDLYRHGSDLPGGQGFRSALGPTKRGNIIGKFASPSNHLFTCPSPYRTLA